MGTENRQDWSESGENFEIGIFRPEDARGIADLFRSVYREDYPIKVFYDPAALTRANETREYVSIVARTPGKAVVAVQHVFRSAPCSALYEVGAGLVSTQYRRLGLNKKTLQFLYEEWIPENPSIEQTLGEPVCNHPYQQRVVSEFAHVEMALEVALMPAAAYQKEKSAPGRVAALMVFRTYKPRPHTVFLPQVYGKQLRFIYGALDDTRTLASSDMVLPQADQSSGEVTVFDFAQVARVAMHRVGFDLAGYVEDLEKNLIERGVVVIQMWLQLAWPWVGAAVDVLRRRGYFLGGPLPRWFNYDGLLMQKVLGQPGFDQIQLYASRAQEILEMVREDWRQTKE
jgi:hypothetical protein